MDLAEPAAVCVILPTAGAKRREKFSVHVSKTILLTVGQLSVGDQYLSDTPGLRTRLNKLRVYHRPVNAAICLRYCTTVKIGCILRNLFHKENGISLQYTLYECPFEKVSLQLDIILRQCFLTFFSIEEPNNNFSCPEEPMKTKTKEEVFGSARSLFHYCQFPDKNRSDVWRHVWNFFGISKFVFYLFHDFSRNHELCSAER